MRAYNRKWEFEADEFAIRIVAEAGIADSAFMTGFQQLVKDGNDEIRRCKLYNEEIEVKKHSRFFHYVCNGDRVRMQRVLELMNRLKRMTIFSTHPPVSQAVAPQFETCSNAPISLMHVLHERTRLRQSLNNKLNGFGQAERLVGETAGIANAICKDDGADSDLW